MSELRNADGQNSDEFMKAYKKAGWPDPALTADVILLSIVDNKPGVLLAKRSNFPDIGQWAFPGGFVEKDESCEEAAARELAEETSLKDLELEQSHTVSTPGRDPRARIASICYMGFVPEPLKCVHGSDAADCKWFSIDYAAKDNLYELVLKASGTTIKATLKVVRLANGKVDINRTEIVEKDGIAFDHAKSILYCIEGL